MFKPRFLSVVAAALLALTAGLGAVAPIARCQLEDAPSCVWVGTVQGNGRGDTVVNGPTVR